MYAGSKYESHYNMDLIIEYGLLGLVLGLGLGLGLILYCRIWRPLALAYMCPQPAVLRVRVQGLAHGNYPNSKLPLVPGFAGNWKP